MEPFSFPLDTVKTFGVAFGTTLVFIWLLRTLSFFQRSVTRTEGERTETYPRYFRFGGVALFLGFLLALCLDERLVFDLPLKMLLFGGGIAFFFGLLDDLWPLHWLGQLGVQSMLGGLLFWGGMTIDQIHLGGGKILDFTLFPGLAFVLTLFWVILIMNAMNWVDGVDGLMGGVMSIAFSTLFLLSLRPEVNQPALALLATMLLGALVAFLLFNWFPAKILAGTSGTAWLGFMLAALAVYAGTKVATALLVLVIPILDALAVIVGRLWQGRSPFLPDTAHFHHSLLALGWSPRQVTLTYMGITLLMATLALATELLEKLVVFVLVASLFFGLALFTGWRAHHQKLHHTVNHVS